MRLFKKAAVCLLAAAMAVSMLTACGDDGPSNPGNGGNGGSTGGGNIHQHPRKTGRGQLREHFWWF